MNGRDLSVSYRLLAWTVFFPERDKDDYAGSDNGKDGESIDDGMGENVSHK